MPRTLLEGSDITIVGLLLVHTIPPKPSGR